ncbi:MAG TPA: hypothetical protein PK231_05750 [Acidocella sp.]|nr:hypothetical protein [Acidocella sp.]
MRDENILSHQLVIQTRQHLERALGVLNTLHLGPLDANILTVEDYCVTASRCIKLLAQEKARG